MQGWLGPALVAALVSGLITALGWFVSYVLGTRLETRRRQERVTDVQTALAAEIRSFFARSQHVDIREHGKRMETWILAEGQQNTPFVPQEPDFLVFRSIAPEIHILPKPVIDPVVLFYTQAATLALFASDLRSERYLSLDPASKNEMYQDYLGLMNYAFQLADYALKALQESLEDERID